MSTTPHTEDRLVPWAELPAGIRERIGPALPPGHAVWACPRKNGRGGIHIEWWWIDARGELIEAFWFE
ncbi:MAG: hypothetical protein HZC37_14540 [Burkholderiales bacterium]|nr:hypothetical protein [Burkholderiales bacterium]